MDGCQMMKTWDGVGVDDTPGGIQRASSLASSPQMADVIRVLNLLKQYFPTGNQGMPKMHQRTGVGNCPILGILDITL